VRGPILDYTIQTDANGKTFFLSGQLTFKDHAEITTLRNQLDELATSQECVFDMKDLEFVDSSGLGSLIAIRESVEQKNIKIVLRHPQPKVMNIIRVCGFDTLFSIEP
jgi:anti-anti-sigma factor